MAGSRTFGINQNNKLTNRELEVLILASKGKHNNEIAILLDISTHTVKAHISAALKKLEVHTRTEAAMKARDLGLF